MHVVSQLVEYQVLFMFKSSRSANNQLWFILELPAFFINALNKRTLPEIFFRPDWMGFDIVLEENFGYVFLFGF
jgi:hypothetical protein